MFYLAFILLELIIENWTAVLAILKCLFPKTSMVLCTAENNHLLDHVYNSLPQNSIPLHSALSPYPEI